MAPSARYHRQRGRRHKKLTDWARQMILQLRRWLPQRPLVLVGDSSATPSSTCSTAANRWSTRYPHRPLAPGRRPLCGPAPSGAGTGPPLKGTAARAEITRRPSRSVLDHRRGSLVQRATRTVELTSGGWYRQPPVPLRWVLVRDPQGDSPHRLCCADLAVEPAQILRFVLRWQLEHLPGGASSPGRGDPTPVVGPSPAPRILMGLFSWTTLAAHLMQEQQPMSHRTAAWYPSRRQLSWMPSPWCAATCGWRPFFTVRRRTGYMESRLPCTADL